MMRTVALFLSVLVLSLASFGQSLPFEVHAGGGFTVPTGDQSGRFTTGGHFLLGGGFSIFPHVELQAEYMYNALGVTTSYANSYLAQSGSAHVNSVTVNPVIHLGAPLTRYGVYATAGIGYYRRTIEFSDPGFSLHNGAFGYNVGGGVTRKLSGPASLFLEVRYHDAGTGRGSTQMVPVTVGIRF